MRKPWITPDDTLEVIEFLQEVSDELKTIAQWSSIRKELRNSLATKAAQCDSLVSRFRMLVIDDSLTVALDTIADRDKCSRIDVIVQALENHISQINRRRA